GELVEVATQVGPEVGRAYHRRLQRVQDVVGVIAAQPVRGVRFDQQNSTTQVDRTNHQFSAGTTEPGHRPVGEGPTDRVNSTVADMSGVGNGQPQAGRGHSVQQVTCDGRGRQRRGTGQDGYQSFGLGEPQLVDS